MRVVLIDPYAKTVTEENLVDASGLRALLKLGKQAVIATPVQNSETGDTLRVNRQLQTDEPMWHFLGDVYSGRGAVVGRGVDRDAAVPLERVKSQVKFRPHN